MSDCCATTLVIDDEPTIAVICFTPIEVAPTPEPAPVYGGPLFDEPVNLIWLGTIF